VPQSLAEVLAAQSAPDLFTEVDGLPVFFGGAVSELLSAVRGAEGESPEFGTLPVTEEVFETETRAQGDDDMEPVLALSTWTEKDRTSLLSKISLEALDLMLSSLPKRGPWWSLEPEVLFEELAKSGFILDAGGVSRLRALHAICSAPEGRCPYYTDPNAYRFLTICLAGRPTNFDDPVLPSPHEMAIALHVVQRLRPFPLEGEVLGMIAVCCYQHGLWVPTGILAVAQKAIRYLARNMDIPIDQERIARVVDLARRERADSSTIPNESLDADDAQALRVIDFEDGVEQALDAGARMREAVQVALDRKSG